jgi:hypothetical protein
VAGGDVLFPCLGRGSGRKDVLRVILVNGEIDQTIDSLTQAKRTAMQAQSGHGDLSLTGECGQPYGFALS